VVNTRPALSTSPSAPITWSFTINGTATTERMSELSMNARASTV
jgi:hypothetical protein